MLFSFNKFWKTLCLIMASWVVYGIFNFEIVETFKTQEKCFNGKEKKENCSTNQ
jgi:hypothetical protein